MKKENQIQTFDYEMRVYNTPVEAALASTRRQRKIAERMFVARYGRERFETWVRPALKDGTGMTGFFESYPEPLPYPQAYVNYLAVIVDTDADRFKTLQKNEDEGAKIIRTQATQRWSRKIVEQWKNSHEPGVRPDPDEIVGTLDSMLKTVPPQLRHLWDDTGDKPE